MNKSESKYFNTAIKIDEAFLKLLSKKELEYITVKEICLASDVSRSTFYLHYETINDLLLETAEYINGKFYSYFDHLEIDCNSILTASKEELIFITPEFLNPWLSFIKENKLIYSTVLKKFDTIQIFSDLFSKINKTFLRGLVIFSEKRWQYIENSARNRNRTRLFRLISKFLILLDFALIIPISLMVLSRRTVVMGKIPAIATAAYTAYKITVSAVNYKKAKNRENLSLLCLKIINLKDAMVSVLTLQNTLISVFDSGKSMLTLTSCTSAAQLTSIIIMTFFWIKKGKSIG